MVNNGRFQIKGRKMKLRDPGFEEIEEQINIFNEMSKLDVGTKMIKERLVVKNGIDKMGVGFDSMVDGRVENFQNKVNQI